MNANPLPLRHTIELQSRMQKCPPSKRGLLRANPRRTLVYTTMQDPKSLILEQLGSMPLSLFPLFFRALPERVSFYFSMRKSFGAAHWVAQWERWKTEPVSRSLLLQYIISFSVSPGVSYFSGALPPTRHMPPKYRDQRDGTADSHSSTQSSLGPL